MGDMDAIQLLTRQHREVEKLFEQFERAGERAHRLKEGTDQTDHAAPI